MGNIPVSLESGKWINQGNHGKGPQNEEWDREMISGHTVVPLSGAQPQATSDPNTEQTERRDFSEKINLWNLYPLDVVDKSWCGFKKMLTGSHGRGIELANTQRSLQSQEVPQKQTWP